MGGQYFLVKVKTYVVINGDVHVYVFWVQCLGSRVKGFKVWGSGIEEICSSDERVGLRS